MDIENNKYNLPTLHEKYQLFSKAGIRLLKGSGKKDSPINWVHKSKVTFGEGKQVSVAYETKPSYSNFISSNTDNIRQLPEYKECENEIKNQPNYKQSIGMDPFYFLTYLVNKTSSLDFNEAIFNELYIDFEKLVLTLEVSYKLFASIGNFSMDEDIIELGVGIRLKKMTAEELSDMIDCSSTFDSFSHPLMFRHRLEIDYQIKESLEPMGRDLHAEAKGTIKKVISTLRLFKCGDIYDAKYSYMPVSWTLFARGVISSYPSVQPRMQIKAELRLEKSEIEDFKKFWVTYNEFIPKLNTFLFINTAISRFNFAYENNRVEDRLIDYMIAFEALFLKGNENQELNYRLALRTAIMIFTVDDPKTSIFSDMKNAYKLRSLIVHGKNFDEIKRDLETKHLKINNFILKIEEYLRRAIKKFMELMNEPSNQDKIIDFLDSNILK